MEYRDYMRQQGYQAGLLDFLFADGKGGVYTRARQAWLQGGYKDMSAEFTRAYIQGADDAALQLGEDTGENVERLEFFRPTGRDAQEVARLYARDRR